MKLLLIIISFFLSLQLGFSQEKIPFPNIEGTWDIQHSVYTGNDFPFEEHMERYFIKDDTVINNATYYKVYQQFGFKYFQSQFYNTVVSDEISSPDYFAAMRTDSLSNVKVIYSSESIEKNLYKFDVEINDTIWIDSFMDDSYYSVVIDIDSILINNIYKKRIKLNNLFDEWIEGIGSIYGLFFPYFLHGISDYYSLLCYKENNVEIYNLSLNDSICGCDLFDKTLSSTNQSQIKESIKIFYSVNEIRISFCPDFKTLRLLNLNGSVIKDYNILDCKDFIINRDEIQTKFMILQMIDNKNKNYIEKIIK